jgi:hypothetical protein
MPKQSARKIDAGSPAFICIVYPLAALVAILIFRLFSPNAFLNRNGGGALAGGTYILEIFRAGNSLTRGLLDFISVYPAIFMSAQFIPFRRIPLMDSAWYQRFSPKFFKLLRPQLIAALVSAIVYGLLFFLVRPVCVGYQIDIRAESALFAEAKEKTILYANKEDWIEASEFMSVCENIWPLSSELAGLREAVDIGLSRIIYSRGKPENPLPAGAGSGAKPVDGQSAFAMAEDFMAKERYYDAHRLAVIAERLFAPGSVEAVRASRLAGAAWNAIESLAPNAGQLKQYDFYRRKQEGYEAMNSGEWVRAYYIFRGLIEEDANDPDVRNFFELSAEGMSQIAFFNGEMNERLGLEISAPVFSLPLFEAEGRAVMRLSSLSTMADYSYGRNFEIAAFDSEQNPLYSVEAPYVKFLPFYINEKTFTLVYLQAFSRDYENMRWGPLWRGSPPPNAPENQIILAISYEDFLLASSAGKNMDSFFLSDIWLLSERLANYGYLPEVYHAEIISNIMKPLLFLPLMMFSLIIGWQMRGKKRYSSAVLPMFFVLPLVLTCLIQVLRRVIDIYSVFSVLSFGFTVSLALGVVTAALLFVLGVVLLAAQRS